MTAPSAAALDSDPMHRLPGIRARGICAGLGACLAASLAVAQEPTPPDAGPGERAFTSTDGKSGKKAKAPADAWAFDVRAGLAYEVNTFQLTPGSLKDLARDRAADRAAGRFDDMESADDLVLRVGAGAEWRPEGPAGARWRAGLDPLLRVHMLNPRATYAGIDAHVSRELGKRTTVRLGLTGVPERFRRNSMADADDVDGNGRISDDERRYRPVRTMSAGARLALAWEFGETPRDEARIFVGVAGEGYRAPFADRRTVEPEAGIDATFWGTKTAGTRIGYRIGWRDNRTHREVLLVDEPRFDLDLNGDGDILDEDVRSVQRVDRSTLDQEVALDFVWKAAGETGGRLAFDLRVRKYLSGQRFDRDHKDRWDVRLGGRFALTFTLAADASLDAGVAAELQTRSREGSAIDKTDIDYVAATLFVLCRVGF